MNVSLLFHSLPCSSPPSFSLCKNILICGIKKELIFLYYEGAEKRTTHFRCMMLGQLFGKTVCSYQPNLNDSTVECIINIFPISVQRFYKKKIPEKCPTCPPTRLSSKRRYNSGGNHKSLQSRVLLVVTDVERCP